MFCKCGESNREYSLAFWQIIRYKYTPCKFSRIYCKKCKGNWITRAKYVELLPNPEQTLFNMTLNDDSPMPWGTHKGETMENVPCDYLLWLFENGKCTGNVKVYIEDNMDVLKHQQKQQNK